MSLRWRIVTVLLIASILPLLILGLGTWIVVGGLLQDKSLEVHRALVRGHAAKIDLYLAERLRALEFASRELSATDRASRAALRRTLENLNASYTMSFIDLGIIDQNGRHLAYVGPYALEDKNYSAETWFLDVFAQGAYVSDVFLGFRGVPHVVIAILRREEDRSWILRATINSDPFYSLVRTELLGQTGDAFIVNRQGLYQTPPRGGRVLEPSPIRNPEPHSGVLQSRIGDGEDAMLQATTWLNGGRWMLVVNQAESEIRAPLRHAMMLGFTVALLAGCLLVGTIFFATWHLSNRIDQANAQRDRIHDDLMRSARLASIGELATGLAHEINNPLAIISAEQTNLGDMLDDLPGTTPMRSEMLNSVARCARQVERCGGITAKMLQFGRKGDTVIKPTDLAPRLQEAASLLSRQASVRNVQLKLEVEPGLPPVMVEPTELEQVIVNLLSNSLQALDGGGKIEISARSSGDAVLLEVTDNGPGIPKEHLDRIFEPFFTTKPAGKGTGLGLAVCHGLVRGWGGEIDAASIPGKETTIRIRLRVQGRR